MTTDAVHLLIALQGRGFRLRVDGDTLYVSPSDALTQDDRTAIRTHKPDLISLVRGEGDGLPFGDQPGPEDGPAAVVWEGLPSLGTWRRVEASEVPTADLWPAATSAGVAGGTGERPGGKSVRGKAKPAHGTSFFDS